MRLYSLFFPHHIIPIPVTTGIGFSCFHTAYWIWYVTSFIPHVNATPNEFLHIDPTLGLVGLLFSIAVQTVFFVYPTRLVSKLTYDEHTQRLMVYTHNLPLVIPSSTPSANVPVGQIVMDPASDDTQAILDKHYGDIQQFVGHVGVGPPAGSRTKLWSLFPYMSYLVDVRQPSNVPEPDLLLQLMLDPEEFQKISQNNTGRSRNAISPSSKQHHRARSSKKSSRRRRESQLQKILKKRR